MCLWPGSGALGDGTSEEARGPPTRGEEGEAAWGSGRERALRGGGAQVGVGARGGQRCLGRGPAARYSPAEGAGSVAVGWTAGKTTVRAWSGHGEENPRYIRFMWVGEDVGAVCFGPDDSTRAV
jgi:hypothetical protein